MDGRNTVTVPYSEIGHLLGNNRQSVSHAMRLSLRYSAAVHSRARRCVGAGSVLNYVLEEPAYSQL